MFILTLNQYDNFMNLKIDLDFLLAVRALTMLTKQPSSSDDDLSPMQPLPLVQQRENYLV